MPAGKSVRKSVKGCRITSYKTGLKDDNQGDGHGDDKVDGDFYGEYYFRFLDQLFHFIPRRCKNANVKSRAFLQGYQNVTIRVGFVALMKNVLRC